MISRARLKAPETSMQGFMLCFQSANPATETEKMAKYGGLRTDDTSFSQICDVLNLALVGLHPTLQYVIFTPSGSQIGCYTTQHKNR